MPQKRKRGQHRARTSSQGSVEIQVTEDETIITATTATTTIAAHATSTEIASAPSQALYFINSDFLTLLKNVGAKGEMSPKGEVFTFKQLGYYLKEYISVHKLYDEVDPAVVHCEKDPLGKVFGVPTFTFYQATSLLLKHAFRLLGTLRDNEPKRQDSTNSTSPKTEQQDIVTSTVGDEVNSVVTFPNSMPSRLTSTAAGSARGVTEMRQYGEFELSEPRHTLPRPHHVPVTSQIGSGSCHTLLEPSQLTLGDTLPGDTRQNNRTQEETSASNTSPGHNAADRTLRSHSWLGDPAVDPSLMVHTTADEISPGHSATDETSRGHTTPGHRIPQDQTTPDQHDRLDQTTPDRTMPFPGTSHDCSGTERSRAAHGVKRKRKHRESGGSESRASGLDPRSPDEDPPIRRRPPSISLVVDEWKPQDGSSYKWWQYIVPLVPLIASSDESEILSIQSKETVIVKSSSDDAWFTDNDLDQWTIDPPFEVEYDVESDQKSRSGDSTVESDSTEILEEPMELYLVCRESDVEWWADSESSDSSPDEYSTDAELTDEDKWKCEKCGTANSPLRRHCDRCMQVRVDWLPPPRLDREANRRPARICPSRKANQVVLCSSSGEDEDDGPPVGNTPQSIVRPLELSTSSPPDGGALQTELGCDISMNTRVDSGLELCSSQESTGSVLTPASVICSEDGGSCSQDIGGGMKTESIAHHFECSTPILQQLDTPALSRVRASTWGSGGSNNTSISSNGSASASSHGDGSGQLASAGTDSGLASSQTSRDDSLRTDQHRVSLSNFQVPSPSRVSLCRHNPPATTTSFAKHVPHNTHIQKARSLNSIETRSNTTAATAMCTVCFVKPKDASIIHGNTGHQVCCYKCAKKLRRKGKTCPVCRRKIQKVIRNFIV